MRGWQDNATLRAAVIGVVAGALFLVFRVLTDDFDATAVITAVGVGAGAAIGGEIGRRRADRSRAPERPDRPERP